VPVVGAYLPLEADYFEYDELESVLNQGFEMRYNVNEECLGCLGIERGDCSSKYFDKHVEQCYYYENCPDGSIGSSTHCSSHRKSMFSISLSHYYKCVSSSMIKEMKIHLIRKISL
jgi:hypothetical protein